jgi:hypothetical protein
MFLAFVVTMGAASTANPKSSSGSVAVEPKNLMGTSKALIDGLGVKSMEIDPGKKTAITIPAKAKDEMMKPSRMLQLLIMIKRIGLLLFLALYLG